MPKLLGTAWTRFHVSGTPQYPTGRSIEFEEHPDIEGAWQAEITEDELEALSAPAQDGKSTIDHNGWKLADPAPAGGTKATKSAPTSPTPTAPAAGAQE